VYRLFFFEEKTANPIIHHDMLELGLMSQLLQGKPNIVFQNDGAP
jgi:hypothetical protein